MNVKTANCVYTVNNEVQWHLEKHFLGGGDIEVKTDYKYTNTL